MKQNEKQIICCKNLGKQYPNGVWGIRGVNFKITAGEMVALVGPNGAGKTTLIHLLAGVLCATEGSVQFAQLPDRNLGWVSQHPVIDWFMNVEDNVVLGSRLAGSSLKESKQNAKEALKMVKLNSSTKKQPDQLSGGQQQRLQIARAISFSPKILFLDEPTTGLDPHFSEMFLADLVERAKKGACILISSHDLGLLETYCERMIYVFEGKIVFDGLVREFVQSQKKVGLREAFLSMSQRS